MTNEIFDLSGKVAAVTGAGANGGIGHAIAIGFAQFGANLVISDIDDKGLEKTRQEIEALGREVIAIHCDISNRDEIEELFSQVEIHFARLDILVNVPFYYPHRAKPHELELEAWEKTLSVNLTGYFLCAQAAIRRMLGQSEGGSIINISSTAGVTALGRGNFPYSCSKAGVNQMTRELAIEYASAKIRCNAIVPAQVLTPGFRQALLEDPRFKDRILPHILRGLPIGRLLEPQEFVGPAVFLASKASQAVTGILLPIDGGNLALNASGSCAWPSE
jgi:NAD(P)-dependent dehydrogenase (short-subunit alcohol dehydrogenase family)